jgi:type IV secretion system protein VirB8
MTEPAQASRHWGKAGETCVGEPDHTKEGVYASDHLLFDFSAMRMFYTGSPLRCSPGADQLPSGDRPCTRDVSQARSAEISLITAPAIQAYFREAESWDADRTAQYCRSARTAWWVAGAGWSCAVASASALALLMPLKRVDPFVVRVDSTTGVVDVVPVYAGRATPEEAVTRYFLTHYLTVCERFNFSTAESDYEECGAFHSAQRNQAWYAQWATTNPASPLNIHKDGSTVRVQVSSVSFFTRTSGLTDLAQVRYLKASRQGAGSEESITHWVATIQYAYADPAKDPKIRRWNPLGFKIVDFRSEPEVLVEQPIAKELHHGQ